MSPAPQHPPAAAGTPQALRPGRHFADLGDVRLHYVVRGEGPPLLLIHGGGDSARAFGRQLPALARHFRCIAPDSRGHGRSSAGAAPLTYARMAGDLPALLDHLGLEAVHVLGWSDGGIIGLHLAMHHAARVRRLALFGANFRVEGYTQAFRDWLRTATPETWFPGAAEAFLRQAPDPERWPALVAQLKRLWSSEPDWDEAALGRIRAPTLVAVGDRDVVRLEHALALYRAIPGAQLCVLPGATHDALAERPALANAIVRDFLRADAEG